MNVMNKYQFFHLFVCFVSTGEKSDKFRVHTIIEGLSREKVLIIFLPNIGVGGGGGGGGQLHPYTPSSIAFKFKVHT